MSERRPVALITGASAGIGAEFARQLAPAWDLVLVARRRDRLEQLAAELSAHGCRAEVLPADLSQPEDCEKVAARIGGEVRLELVVNNAGFGAGGLFWTADYPQQEKMHHLHIRATLRLCHAALQAFVPRNRGAVINVASVAAFVRGVGSGGYGATKSWMAAFTEGLHLDLRSTQSRVSVQVLCPGFTYSEFHDVMGQPRLARAPRWAWLSAKEVVSASLAALPRRKLYVVPNWKYALLVALITKLPVKWRVVLESRR